MGSSGSKSKGEANKPQERKGESEVMKAPEVVDASTQMTPDTSDNGSIDSRNIEDIPFPEQETTTECGDNKSNKSAGTTCSLVGEETAKNIKQN